MGEDSRPPALLPPLKGIVIVFAVGEVRGIGAIDARIKARIRS